MFDRRRFQPVRVRIALAATVVTALAMVGSGWLLIRSIEETQVAQLRREADAELDRIAAAFAAGEDWDIIEGFSSGITSLEVADAEGQVLVDATGGMSIAVGGVAQSTTALDVDGAGVRVDADGIKVVSACAVDSQVTTCTDGVPEDWVEAEAGAGIGDEAYGMAVGLDAAGPYETVVRTFDGPGGEVTMTGFLPVDEVSRSVAAVRRSLLWGLPVVVALVGFSVWWWVGRALRPVEAIRAEAEAIGGATMHRRVPEPAADDEVGRLARTMNRMLDRLDRSARRQRQFVADASHELRSPVAAIRTDLEVALHEGDRADWPAVARDVLAEEARLERLLADLLVLAAVDEQDGNGDGLGGGAGRVDLVRVVSAEAARARRVTPMVTVPDGEVPVRGSEARWCRLVGNVLDNAVRHADRRVELSLCRVSVDGDDGPGTVRLTVEDDGPGIPIGDRERVFDRFIRLDEGRARDEGGAGLGLAVVRAIAQRHGGSVVVEDSALGGARLAVEVPAIGAE